MASICSSSPLFTTWFAGLNIPKDKFKEFIDPAFLDGKKAVMTNAVTDFKLNDRQKSVLRILFDVDKSRKSLNGITYTGTTFVHIGLKYYVPVMTLDTVLDFFEAEGIDGPDDDIMADIVSPVLIPVTAEDLMIKRPNEESEDEPVRKRVKAEPAIIIVPIDDQSIFVSSPEPSISGSVGSETSEVVPNITHEVVPDVIPTIEEEVVVSETPAEEVVTETPAEEVVTETPAEEVVA